MTWLQILNTALDKNPNVLSLIVTAFLLPVVIVWLNNRQARNLKKIESECAQEKEEREKRTRDTDLRRDKESFVYGALLQILFCVQSLHAKLSSVRPESANDFAEAAFKDLEDEIRLRQRGISEAQATIRPELIPYIYEVYAAITELQLELRTLLSDSGGYDALLPCVVTYSQRISGDVVKYHEKIMRDIRPEMIEAARSIMRCCGRQPTVDEMRAYEERKAKFNFVCLVPSMNNQEQDINHAALIAENPLAVKLEQRRQVAP